MAACTNAGTVKPEMVVGLEAGVLNRKLLKKILKPKVDGERKKSDEPAYELQTLNESVESEAGLGNRMKQGRKTEGERQTEQRQELIQSTRRVIDVDILTDQ